MTTEQEQPYKRRRTYGEYSNVIRHVAIRGAGAPQNHVLSPPCAIHTRDPAVSVGPLT